MSTSLFQIAAKISTPLALAGIIVVVFYLLYRLFLKSTFLSKISSQSSFKLLNRLITYIFVLALVATFLGILGHYVVKIFQPKMARSDIIYKMDERRNSLISILKFRADTAVTNMDTVIKRLESVAQSEIKHNKLTSMPHFSNANETINRLKKLKSEFLTLNNRHLAAIQKGDIQLSHEINRKIQSLLYEFDALVLHRYQTIKDEITRDPSILYAQKPRPSTNKEQLFFRRVRNYINDLKIKWFILKLYTSTVSISNSIEYPGSPPSHIPQGQIDLAFSQRQ